MSKEIEEITIELEFGDDLAYEWHFEEGDVKIYKKAGSCEEEVSNDGKLFNENLMEELMLNSGMNEEEITEHLLRVLGSDSFIEVEVEIVFSDGTEVGFKIEGKDFDEIDTNEEEEE